MTPDDVLKFWFGDEITAGPSAMDTSEYMSKSGGRWFSKNDDFDNEVKSKFSEVIRKASSGALGPEWEGAKGRQARIILFDQLSRNAFRGTAEAFEYDEAAVQLARAAVKEDLSAEPVAVVQFLLMPLMHSESLDDQDALVAKLKEAVAARTGYAPELLEKNLIPFAVAHRDVIVKFGRFPHRNDKYGRETTADEAAWLASEECPGWAKSQA